MKRIAWLAPCLLFTLVTPALACPVCDSGTGRQVRAELADEHLELSVVATVAPFAIVLGIIAAVHYGPPRIRRKP